jgi:hypothetical protein
VVVVLVEHHLQQLLPLEVEVLLLDKVILAEQVELKMEFSQVAVVVVVLVHRVHLRLKAQVLRVAMV